MSLSEIEAAINLLSARVADLEQFDPDKIDKRWHPRVTALHAAIDGTLAAVFGNKTPDYIRYAAAKELDTARHTSLPSGIPFGEVRAGLRHGKERAIGLLRQAISALGERKIYLSAQASQSAPSSDSEPRMLGTTSLDPQSLERFGARMSRHEPTTAAQAQTETA
jgi:hypothetical protein